MKQYFTNIDFPERREFPISLPKTLYLLGALLVVFSVAMKFDVRTIAQKVTLPLKMAILAGWWLNQPIWNIFVKLDHFPK